MDEIDCVKNILLDKMCCNCRFYLAKMCKFHFTDVNELGTCESWEKETLDAEYQAFIHELAKAAGVPKGYLNAKFES